MHTFVNRYFALIMPNNNPAAIADQVRMSSGLIVCASSSILTLLNDRMSAPLYQTSAASNLRVRVEVLNMRLQCNTVNYVPEIAQYI